MGSAELYDTAQPIRAWGLPPVYSGTSAPPDLTPERKGSVPHSFAESGPDWSKFHVLFHG